MINIFIRLGKRKRNFIYTGEESISICDILFNASTKYIVSTRKKVRRKLLNIRFKLNAISILYL